MRHFEQKQIGVEQLRSKAHQYREWEKLRSELIGLDTLLIPAARHFEAAEELLNAARDLRIKEEEVEGLKADTAEDGEGADGKRNELTELEQQHAELVVEEKGSRRRAEAAAKIVGQASERASTACGTDMPSPG